MAEDEARSLWTAVTIIYSNVGSERSSGDLRLILERSIGLHNSNGELSSSVWFQIFVPKKTVYNCSSPEAAFQRSETRSEHHSLSSRSQKMKDKQTGGPD